MSHDTPEAVAITNKVAAELAAHEKAMHALIGTDYEVCPKGTLARVNRIRGLLKELREVLA